MVSRHNKLYSNHSYPVVLQNKRSKVDLHCYQNQCEDKTDLSMVHRIIIADNFIIFFTCKSFLACINVDGLSNILTNHIKNVFRYCRINRYALNIRCILGILYSLVYVLCVFEQTSFNFRIRVGELCSVSFASHVINGNHKG